ncbi:collagen-like protein [Massilia arenosa]|uniref:Collagen-like protein n=1 Tax=Zemynaea arenosa TaxID=2561931 RepID=A0A4Y9S928_9BURK|nr:collagen-like protein [Massilia arenosa]TFW17930.1 collagen-like protein [Massilia arenosa]
MKTPLLAAVLAVAALSGCEKTTVNPPATVVTPAADTTVAAPAPATTTVVEKEVPVAVPVQGPPGPAGEKGEKGEKGDTTVVVPHDASVNSTGGSASGSTDSGAQR